MCKSAIAEAYWPIIRGYAVVMVLFYGAMTAANAMVTTGVKFAIFVGTTGASALILLATFFALKKWQGRRALIAATFLANALILLNIEVALRFAYNESKLVYFVMALMIFGLASVSFRASLLWTAIGLVHLSAWVVVGQTEQAITLAFVGFAAALSATTISFNLQRAIAAAKSAELATNETLQSVERDLDEQKSAGLLLKRQSLSDSLTGLANRRAFFDMLRQQTKLPQGGWLALLDLDGFKSVNDNHGHIMGDELLKSVSFRLRTFCQPRAHVSRMGGDEFALIIAEDMCEDDVVRWMEKLLSRLGATYPIEGRLIQISGSIGCCRIEQGQNESTVFKSADFALLHAKRTGKSRVVSFNDEHAQAFAERFRIERALRSANLPQEIELVFQPQFDLRSNSVVRAEALARWNSPDIGSIKPEEFISVAEECGLMMDITVTVLRKALDSLAERDEPIPLSINLSAADLNSSQTMMAILGLLEQSTIDPSLIEFEVTESAMLIDIARGTEQLQLLAARGHTIAIDDFGTGYSNFNYLRSLPINKLKIDRSFLEDLQDPMTEKILRSLVSVAGTLDVECLLEGVEDELGLLMAKRSGVGLVQGYLIGRPTDLDKLVSAPDVALRA